MRRRAAAAVVALLATAALAVPGFAAAQRYLFAPPGDDGVITLLLVGSDLGPPRGGNPLEGNADAFHLLVANPATGKATFVNFPRDAYVPVAGQGRAKLNSCLWAGPERCVTTVENNWDVEVDYWMVTTFKGLQTAVDRFGGVPVNVPRRLTDGGEDIGPGNQRLTGAQALTFARDRKNRPDHDFGRSAAQAELLAAAHRDLFASHPSVGEIAETVAKLQQTTETNARPDELLRLGYLAMTVDPAGVDSVTLPGRLGFAGAASVVYLSPAAAGIVADVAADGAVGP